MNSKKIFLNALRQENNDCPPIWIMRQAGRYHSGYQNIRKQHDFLKICKTPSLAAEVALMPVKDFDFDAAILFSDILFTIETMGINIKFDPGPKFDKLLKDVRDLKFYNVPKSIEEKLDFQRYSLQMTRNLLPKNKALIGFVGGPFTLFYFAVNGSSTSNKDSQSFAASMNDGRFEGFMDRITEILIKNIMLQVSCDIDALAIFDSRTEFLEINFFLKKNTYNT